MQAGGAVRDDADVLLEGDVEGVPEGDEGAVRRRLLAVGPAVEQVGVQFQHVVADLGATFLHLPGMENRIL